MRRIVLSMQNYVFADAIETTLKKGDSDFDVYKAPQPKDIVELCRCTMPYALLMEVSSYPPLNLEHRLKVRDQIKSMCPQCRIVLLVDENSEKEIASCVTQAKKDGLIDQFFYGSISATYLVALMDTL